MAITSGERPKNRSISRRAWASLPSERFCSVMSRAIIDAPTIPPVESRTSEIASDTSTSDPFLRRCVVSKRSECSPAATGASNFATSSSRASGTSSPIDLPWTSASEYPYSCSAPGFQLTISPSVVSLMIGRRTTRPSPPGARQVFAPGSAHPYHNLGSKPRSHVGSPADSPRLQLGARCRPCVARVGPDQTPTHPATVRTSSATGASDNTEACRARV